MRSLGGVVAVRGLLLVATGVGIVAARGEARAQARARPVTALEWRVPEGGECATREDIAALVDERLEREVFGPARPAATRTVRGEVTRTGGDWGARIVLVDERGSALGTRELRGSYEHCRSLDRALSIIVSLLVELEQPAITIHDSLEEPARAPAQPIVRLDALAGVSGEMLPGIAGVARMGVGIAFSPLASIAVEACWWPGTTEVANERGASFEALRIAAGAAPWLLYGRRATLRARLLFGATVLRARGVGLADARDARGVALDASGGADVAIRIVGPLAVTFGLDLAAVLLRPTTVYSSGGAEVLVHSPGPVSWGAFAGLSVDARP